MRVAFKTDFRAWLQYEHLNGCRENLTTAEFLNVLYGVCFQPGQVIQDVEFMVCALKWFHGRGNIEQTSRLEECIPPRLGPKVWETLNNQPKLSDAFWDAVDIYDSFMLQYGICLYTTNMHWWKFVALMKGLRLDMPYNSTKQLRGLARLDVIDGGDNESKEHRMVKQRQLWEIASAEQYLKQFPDEW